jgi:hypothetical protein
VARARSISARRSLLHFGKPKRCVMGGAKNDIDRRVRCSKPSSFVGCEDAPWKTIAYD